MTTVRAAVGKEHGDGLIGLSYLRQFNYQVRSAEGRLLVERAASR